MKCLLLNTCLASNDHIEYCILLWNYLEVIKLAHLKEEEETTFESFAIKLRYKLLLILK